MYRFNWILRNELAISSAPTKKNHLEKLKSFNIKSILSLCYEGEIESEVDFSKEFQIVRFSLPDHKKNSPPSFKDIQKAISILDDLYSKKPVLVHCFAGMERSPLICTAWLMFKYKYSLYEALDYIKQVHPPACPLDYQIEVLREIKNFNL